MLLLQIFYCIFFVYIYSYTRHRQHDVKYDATHDQRS